MRLGPWSKAVFASAAVILMLIALAPRLQAAQVYSGSDLSGYPNQAFECYQPPCNQTKTDNGVGSMVSVNPGLYNGAFMNVLWGYQLFNYDWRNLQTETYQVSVWTPAFGWNTQYGDEATTESIQLWDGSVKIAYEYTVILEASPWNTHYGWLGAFSGPKGSPLVWLLSVGGFNGWHTVKIVVHIQSKTFDVYWDGTLVGQGIAAYINPHTGPGWGSDISGVITAETSNLYPGQGQATFGWAWWKNWSWTLS